jgi:hypothetical protein
LANAEQRPDALNAGLREASPADLSWLAELVAHPDVAAFLSTDAPAELEPALERGELP